MDLVTETPEMALKAGANWGVVEYLLFRFNHAELIGNFILRRTPMLKRLQFSFVGESHGRTLTVLSRSFVDSLLLDEHEREQLVKLVSFFLLEIKNAHAKQGSFTHDPASNW